MYVWAELTYHGGLQYGDILVIIEESLKVVCGKDIVCSKRKAVYMCTYDRYTIWCYIVPVAL